MQGKLNIVIFPALKCARKLEDLNKPSFMHYDCFRNEGLAI